MSQIVDVSGHKCWTVSDIAYLISLVLSFGKSRVMFGIQHFQDIQKISVLHVSYLAILVYFLSVLFIMLDSI